MSLKQRLHDDSVILSTMVGEVKSTSLPQMLKAGGLDSFIIDMEHGTHSWSEMATLITAGKSIGLYPVVRIPAIHRESVMKPFDAGAAGILVPMVETPEEVAEIVHWGKYPPLGARGVSLRRGHNDFLGGSLRDQLVRGNEETAIIVQIESVPAVEAVDEIVAVEGLDAIFIGPNDLSVSVGVPGDLHAPEMMEIYDRLITSALKAQVAVGFQVSTVDEALGLIARGIRYVSYCTDVSALIDKAAEISQGVRAGAGSIGT